MINHKYYSVKYTKHIWNTYCLMAPKKIVQIYTEEMLFRFGCGAKIKSIKVKTIDKKSRFFEDYEEYINM